MSKKISQLPTTTLTGAEAIPLAYQDNNYRTTIDEINARVTKSSLGIGNVDNTSDVNKPLSTATVQALSTKAPMSHMHQIGDIEGLIAALEGKSDVGHNHPTTDIVGYEAPTVKFGVSEW